MSLPDSWVDKVFRKLSATYGQSFLRQYDGVPMEDVKANWAHELSCYQQSPAAIARGLEILPADRAPSVLQFRELCRPPRVEEFAALPAPAVNRDGVKRIAAKLRAMRPEKPNDPKAWAYRLKEREDRSGGAGLTVFQKFAWRSALRASEAA